jgi:hypothetical protein
MRDSLYGDQVSVVTGMGGCVSGYSARPSSVTLPVKFEPGPLSLLIGEPGMHRERSAQCRSSQRR